MIVHIRGNQITMIYDERLDLSRLGAQTIKRASYVEPNETGRWQADLKLVGGPVLGHFTKRSDALGSERDWLERHMDSLKEVGSDANNNKAL